MRVSRLLSQGITGAVYFSDLNTPPFAHYEAKDHYDQSPAYGIPCSGEDKLAPGLGTRWMACSLGKKIENFQKVVEMGR